ncbi:MAG: MerR family transcriptional regulator [Acidobacteria bacterium]|nr:MerR family transcriptional regulator [Acidobacteriota bacterium]
MVTKDNEQQKYNLEELSQAVTKMLDEQGLLDAQQDNRVSAAPDARTIRYYTTLGLLERPSIIGRQAYYGYRHLLQIVAIKALQGLSLPLSEIQAKLYGRSNQELTAILSAISQNHAKKPIEVRLLHWQEVTIEPGLKIMVEEGWTPSQDINSIIEKVHAVLTTLANSKNNQN